MASSPFPSSLIKKMVDDGPYYAEKKMRIAAAECYYVPSTMTTMTMTTTTTPFFHLERLPNVLKHAICDFLTNQEQFACLGHCSRTWHALSIVQASTATKQLCIPLQFNGK
jgi:hypothetical protein